MKQHCLIGKVLTGIELASDGKAIKFATTEGDIIARADGDCCSSTWIESVELPALEFPALEFPAFVTAVEDLTLGEQEGEDDECLQLYGLKIDTDKGQVVIDYRNESNGYYGGEIAFPDDYFYGGVFGQNVSNEDWRPIVE